MRNAQLIRQVKLAARDKYAWPGGYPLFVLMTDGEALCVTCVRKEFAQIARSTRDNARGDWCAEAVSVNWEDHDMFCGHCNEEIEAAYEVEQVQP